MEAKASSSSTRHVGGDLARGGLRGDLEACCWRGGAGPAARPARSRPSLGLYSRWLPDRAQNRRKESDVVARRFRADEASVIITRRTPRRRLGHLASPARRSVHQLELMPRPPQTRGAETRRSGRTAPGLVGRTRRRRGLYQVSKQRSRARWPRKALSRDSREGAAGRADGIVPVAGTEFGSPKIGAGAWGLVGH